MPPQQPKRDEVARYIDADILKEQVEDYLANYAVGKRNIIGKELLTKAIFGHHSDHLERRIRAVIAEITDIAIGLSTEAGNGGYFSCETEEEKRAVIETLDGYATSIYVRKEHVKKARLVTEPPQARLPYMRRAV